MTSTETRQDTARPSQMETLARWGAALKGRLAALIVLGAAALYLPLINAFSDSYDEGVYWQSLRAMAQGHPLFTSVFSSQPPYFLVSLYPFYLLFGQTIAAARIGVAFFGLIGVIAMYWLGSELGGMWAGLLASALLGAAPYYMQQARALQSDGPAVAICILAVALAVAAMRREGSARRLLAALSGAALVYGLLIKLYDVVAVVPIALCFLTPIFSLFDAGQGRLRRPAASAFRNAVRASLPDLGWLAAGALVTAVALLAPFAGSLTALWDQVVTFHIVAQKGLPAQMTDNASRAASDYILFALLALVTLGAAIWRRAWRVAIPFLWLLASIAIVLRLNPFFAHYAALVAPGFALMIALAPGLLAPLFRRGAARWATVAVTLATLALLAGMMVNDITQTGARLNQGISANAEGQLAAMNAFTTPGEVIVTDDPYLAAVAGHSVPPELVDTSYVRSHTGYLTAAQIESVVARDHIRVVFLATNRLRNVPGFMPWLLSGFALAARAGAGGTNGNGFEVYIRIPPGSTVA